MKKYLFSQEDSPACVPFIVQGTSKEDALFKVGKKLFKKDGLFIGHILDRCVNLSYAEKFYLQAEEEINHFGETGEILVDKNQFIDRVKTHFKEVPHLADEYINYYFSESENLSLSDEFLIHEWVFSWQDYQIIDMDELEIIK